MNPLVSIIMPTLNANNFISNALLSIQGQTYKNWELLVIDAGSTDGTLEVLEAQKGYKGFVSVRKGLGIADAHMFGVKKASGKYIARFAADDVMPEKRLEIQVAYLEKHPEIDAVYSDYQEIDYYGNNLEVFATGKIEGKDVSLKDVVKSQIVPIETMMAKAELYQKWPMRELRDSFDDDHYLIANWYKNGVKFKKLKDIALNKRYHVRQHYRLNYEESVRRSKQLEKIFL